MHIIGPFCFQFLPRPWSNASLSVASYVSLSPGVEILAIMFYDALAVLRIEPGTLD